MGEQRNHRGMYALTSFLTAQRKSEKRLLIFGQFRPAGIARRSSGALRALPIALCLALLLSVLWLAPASAHGASVVETDSDFGPYHVVAVTSPVALSGDMLLTVVLSAAGDSADPSPVAGATVKADIQASGAQLVVPVPAEPTRADAGYYETTVNIPGQGDAKVSLDIESAQGSVSVPFTIKRAGLTDWVTLGAESLVTAGLICLLLFAARKLRRPVARAQ